MTQTTDIQKPPSAGPLAVMKHYLADESIKKRFEDMLGARAGAFVNSIINVVGGNEQLMAVARNNPASVCRAAMRAATVNLAIDPALGHAAVVPYGKDAAFQIMYKGIIQLCIRSGMYKTIHCSEIYRDELKSYNPITGEVKFNPPEQYEVRYSEKRTDGDVVGHYIYFRLLTGFEKSDYMTRAEAMAHARKYSKAYQYDLKAGKKASSWSTDPIPMGNKTVLLRCLRRYGVMSIEMQDLLAEDQETFEEAQAAAHATIENETGSEPVDPEFDGDAPPKEGIKPRKKNKKTPKKKVESHEVPKFKYVCRACGFQFDEPKMTGPGNNVRKCPADGCGSIQIDENPDN